MALLGQAARSTIALFEKSTIIVSLSLASTKQRIIDTFASATSAELEVWDNDFALEILSNFDSSCETFCFIIPISASPTFSFNRSIDSGAVFAFMAWTEPG